MATTVRRPPAMLVYRPPSEPRFFDTTQVWNTQYENLGVIGRRQQYAHVQNPLSINPVLEQPRLDWRSLRQPITIEGWRKWVRGGIRASKPFTGNVAQAGYQMNQFTERPKMAGATSRPFTYSYTPAAQGVGPGRTQTLGGSAGGGGRKAQDQPRPGRGGIGFG